MKVHRPWSWNDVRVANGWLTPIGFVSDVTVAYFRQPWFRFEKRDDETGLLSLERPSSDRSAST